MQMVNFDSCIDYVKHMDYGNIWAYVYGFNITYTKRQVSIMGLSRYVALIGNTPQ